MDVFAVLAYLRLLLATALRRLRLGSRSGLSPGSSTLQQPSDIFVHDERDARAGKHPDEIRRQAAVESYEALVRPSVRDRGRDGAVVRACEHRVVLEELVSCVRASARTMTIGRGSVEGVREEKLHLDARADHLIWVCCAKRGELRRT